MVKLKYLINFNNIVKNYHSKEYKEFGRLTTVC